MQRLERSRQRREMEMQKMLEQNRQLAAIEEAEQQKMLEEKREAERKRIAALKERRRMLEEAV